MKKKKMWNHVQQPDFDIILQSVRYYLTREPLMNEVFYKKSKQWGKLRAWNSRGIEERASQNSRGQLKK